jgi:hypothetical protein
VVERQRQGRDPCECGSHEDGNVQEGKQGRCRLHNGERYKPPADFGRPAQQVLKQCTLKVDGRGLKYHRPEYFMARWPVSTILLVHSPKQKYSPAWRTQSATHEVRQSGSLSGCGGTGVMLWRPQPIEHGEYPIRPLLGGGLAQRVIPAQHVQRLPVDVGRLARLVGIIQSF